MDRIWPELVMFFAEWYGVKIPPFSLSMPAADAVMRIARGWCQANNAGQLLDPAHVFKPGFGSPFGFRFLEVWTVLAPDAHVNSSSYFMDSGSVRRIPLLVQNFETSSMKAVICLTVIILVTGISKDFMASNLVS